MNPSGSLNSVWRVRDSQESEVSMWEHMREPWEMTLMWLWLGVAEIAGVQGVRRFPGIRGELGIGSVISEMVMVGVGILWRIGLPR